MTEYSPRLFVASSAVVCADPANSKKRFLNHSAFWARVMLFVDAFLINTISVYGAATERFKLA
jgi:hypothetical protein